MKLTKSTLKQMIKEVLNEVEVSAPGPISPDLARAFGGQPDMAALNKKLDTILMLLKKVRAHQTGDRFKKEKSDGKV